MAYKDKTVIRAAAMQRDRDDGISVAEIAKKYCVSRVTVYNYTCSNDPTKNQALKESRFREGFIQEWNSARYVILLGLRSTWPDEWNAARFKLLGVKE